MYTDFLDEVFIYKTNNPEEPYKIQGDFNVKQNNESIQKLFTLLKVNELNLKWSQEN